MDNTVPFEILTVNGNRFRYDESGWFWEYGLESGTLDVEDLSKVNVYKLDAEEEKTMCGTYSQVIFAGAVESNTCLAMPREKRPTACPRCGFCDDRRST